MLSQLKELWLYVTSLRRFWPNWIPLVIDSVRAFPPGLLTDAHNLDKDLNTQTKQPGCQIDLSYGISFFFHRSQKIRLDKVKLHYQWCSQTWGYSVWGFGLESTILTIRMSWFPFRTCCTSCHHSSLLSGTDQAITTCRYIHQVRSHIQEAFHVSEIEWHDY